MATTALYPYGPGPSRSIADKTPDAPAADRGSTRITVMRPIGAHPYRLIGDKTGSEVASARDDTRITVLRATGAHPVRTITDKAPSLDDAKYRADTILVVLTEGPVDEVSILITDTLRPLVSESAYAQIVLTVSDSIVPIITDVGIVPFAGSPTVLNQADTLVPVVTEAIAGLLQGYWYAGTDSLIPVITEAVASLGKASVVTAADSVVPVITEAASRVIIINSTVPVTDTLALRLTETATASQVAAEVDRIIGKLKPYGQIVVRQI